MSFADESLGPTVITLRNHRGRHQREGFFNSSLQHLLLRFSDTVHAHTDYSLLALVCYYGKPDRLDVHHG